MGGEREDYAPQGKNRGEGRGESGPGQTVPQGKPDPANQPMPTQVAAQAAAAASLRFHVSAGEMHFHDDGRRLKVAVKVADWYAQLRQLLYEGSGRRVFPDRSNNTILVLDMTLESDQGFLVQEAYVELEPYRAGGTLGKLLTTTGW